MLDRNTLERTMVQIGKTQEPMSMSMLSLLLPSRPDLQCAYCHVTYTKHDSLRRHVKHHHLGFRFPCGLCEAEKYRREDLVKHYLGFHPDNVQEAEMVQEVCRVTEDGAAMPLGRPSSHTRRDRACRASPGKRSTRVKARRLGKRLKTEDLRQDSQAQASAASLPAEASLAAQEVAGGGQPQRVVIALDPVTQFRLERVVAERVDRITERSVVETLDGKGRVTRRETVEREYFLNSHE